MAEHSTEAPTTPTAPPQVRLWVALTTLAALVGAVLATSAVSDRLVG